MRSCFLLIGLVGLALSCKSSSEHPEAGASAVKGSPIIPEREAARYYQVIDPLQKMVLEGQPDGKAKWSQINAEDNTPLNLKETYWRRDVDGVVRNLRYPDSSVVYKTNPETGGDMPGFIAENGEWSGFDGSWTQPAIKSCCGPLKNKHCLLYSLVEGLVEDMICEEATGAGNGSN